MASWSPGNAGEAETKANNGLLPSPGGRPQSRAAWAASGGPCYFLCWLRGSWPAWKWAGSRAGQLLSPQPPAGLALAGWSSHCCRREWGKRGSALCLLLTGLPGPGLPCSSLPRLFQGGVRWGEPDLLSLLTSPCGRRHVLLPSARSPCCQPSACVSSRSEWLEPLCPEHRGTRPSRE